MPKKMEALFWITLGLCFSGCVRAGFEQHQVEVGQDATPPDGQDEDGIRQDLFPTMIDLTPLDDAKDPLLYVLTAAHDTCDSPLHVDLSPLGAGVPVSIEIDSTGAHDDYTPCGAGMVDMVVRFTKALVGQFRIDCIAAAPTILLIDGGEICSSGGFEASAALSCSNVTSFITETVYALICCDLPDGSATLNFVPQRG